MRFLKRKFQNSLLTKVYNDLSIVVSVTFFWLLTGTMSMETGEDTNSGL